MTFIESNYDINKKYIFGCVISYFNRISIFEKTLNSIKNSFLPNDMLFVIIDDGSEDKEFRIKLEHDHIIIKKDKNYGISNSLAIGWDILSLLDIEYLLNLDSDVLVANNWLSVLVNTYYESSKENERIVTGFNGTNHKVTRIKNKYKIKNSIGGINIFFHKKVYDIVRKSLTEKNKPTSLEDVINSIESYGQNPKIHPVYKGWDWGLMHLCEQNQIKKICSYKSVVQHIGSVGLTSSKSFFEQSKDYEEMAVPKIIHQMWKDNKIPDHLKIMQDSVVKNHTEYEYKFWTDETIENFLNTYYPNFLDVFNKKFEYIIQKIDFIRILILYHYGGIYIDLDVFCLKNLDKILNYPCSLIVTKKHEAFSKSHYPFVLNNAFIAAEKYNDFIKNIILHIINYENPKNYKEFCSFNPEYTKVLKSTGPLCVTDVFNKYKYKSLINLLSHDYFYGIEYNHKNNNIEEIIAAEVGKKKNECFFLHMHESSWWKKNGVSVMPPKNKKHVKDYTTNNEFYI